MTTHHFCTNVSKPCVKNKNDEHWWYRGAKHGQKTSKVRWRQVKKSDPHHPTSAVLQFSGTGT